MNIYAPKKPKKINSVSVTMFFGTIILGYLLYWWVPILWPIFQMTGIMRTACNEAYRQIDDTKVMNKLLSEAQRTGLPVSEDNFRFRRIPYEPQELEQFVNKTGYIERRGKTCEIDFRYIGTYSIPFTGKTMQLQFDRTVDAPLTPVKYDKLCTCVTVPGGPTPTADPGPQSADRALGARSNEH
ncbi:MAG: hypothetical protein AAF449_13320 [Myxococcota bacterium]